MSKNPINAELSIKNTKEQIFTAYQDTLLKLEEKQNYQDVKLPKQHLEKQEIVTKAFKNNSDSIITDLSNLKINIFKSIEIINESLLMEFDKLSTLKKAIEIEQKHLEEIYAIKENLHTFSALIIAQQEKKEQFELEMQEKQKVLQSNLLLLKEQYEEELALIKKNRQREEEDYKYQLNIQRRKELDDYNFKKAELEKDLITRITEQENRENLILANETKFDELQKRVAEFPNEISETIKNAENNLRASLELEYKHKAAITTKEYEIVIKLGEQQVINLQQKVKEQELHIKELTNKVNLAGEQVQSIACKALDTSSQRYVTNFPDIRSNDKSSSI